MILAQQSSRLHCFFSVICNCTLSVNERKRKPDQHFQRSVPNNSLHVPNNHLDIPAAQSSRWHFTTRRLKTTCSFNSYTSTQPAHTRSASDLSASETLEKCKDYRLSVFIFPSSCRFAQTHIYIYIYIPPRTCRCRNRKAGLRLGDVMRSRDVTETETLTSRWNKWNGANP